MRAIQLDIATGLRVGGARPMGSSTEVHPTRLRRSPFAVAAPIESSRRQASMALGDSVALLLPTRTRASALITIASTRSIETGRKASSASWRSVHSEPLARARRTATSTGSSGDADCEILPVGVRGGCGGQPARVSPSRIASSTSALPSSASASAATSSIIRS
jgi:hypothetical protein